jgi:23S rRNA (cytosine1962-C5)-methyltransferase
MTAPASRPVVRLRVPGSRHHLFFFRKMVVKPEAFIEAGTIVDVLDRGGANLGCGFYNPKSEIAVRMLGAPEENLIENRLRAAAAFREGLKIDADAYRVCHSEGDGLSGLVVDRYAGVHSIEIFSLGMLKQLDTIRKFFPNAYVQADARTQELEGFRLPAAKPPEGVVVQEHGVQFRVDFARGHKTGFFCDQRENRKAVAELAKGRDLLDLCCYTGGFAVSAVGMIGPPGSAPTSLRPIQSKLPIRPQPWSGPKASE